uniref:TSA: Wollemia nobilis Ref_Wollemi_Transcript_13185_1136 transcribed RNA sequence n=1 Tax=Wollemia nobilis TaxID=56998 RepID=A0A0C9S583_9CONI
MAAHPVEDANGDSLFGGLTREEFYDKHNVVHEESFMENKRGMKIFTQSWRPKEATAALRGLVAMVHGFMCSSGWLLELTAIAIAKQGFCVCALDHQGHGLSEGLRGHIPDINPVIDDCIQCFDAFRARNPGLPAFLYAESMGGAIALLIHLRQRGAWAGAVLSGAMCGISAKFKPPWPLEHLLPVVAWAVPTWRVVPTKRISTVACKETWKRRLAMRSPHASDALPRAATALELLRVCGELQGRFAEVTLPLLIVHGGDDMVCDPDCVKALYEEAGSTDKTLKIYEGMWHGLVGEPKENVDRVFGDVYAWLRERADKARDRRAD